MLRAYGNRTKNISAYEGGFWSQLAEILIAYAISILFGSARNLSDHMDRQARTSDTMLV
jgi:hypothetical protein